MNYIGATSQRKQTQKEKEWVDTWIDKYIFGTDGK